MPALVLFGRRSRVGSDDFFCPALLQFLFQIPFVLVCVLYVSTYRSCSTMQIHNLSGLAFWYMLLSIPVMAFMMVMNMLELHVSSQGTIISHESRILMKPLVVVHFAWAAGMFGAGTAGVVLYAMDQICFPDANFVLVVAVGYLTNVFGMVLFACLVIGGTPVHQRRHSCDAHIDVDPENHNLLFGNSDPTLPNSDLYIPHQEHWERRCHRCCACVRCFTCSLFGGGGTQTDAMSVVASVFARFFYGSPDLVFSDIIAGFVLLGAVQYHEKNAADQSPDVLREVGVVPTFPTNLDTPKDAALVAAVADLAYYSKYAIGIYGWMLYVWSHPWKSGPQLVFHCLTTRRRPYILGDNCVHWHQVALQLETGLAASDIVYASFTNAVCKPAFCVTLDHDKKQVVIAIRGTLSLEDCLTDAIAYGVSLNEMAAKYKCEGTGAFAHQGMLQCAMWLMDEITQLQVLPMLLDPTLSGFTPPPQLNACPPGKYADYGLTLTGHSLGAGTAVLLAMMLRPSYPALKCLALSPPGCLLSPDLATSTASFVTSVVLGKDIIARASLLSFQSLRDQVLSLIGRSKVSKTHIMRQALSWQHPDELLHATEDEAGHTAFTSQLLNYRTMLQRIQAREPIHEMWMPGRIVHLKRLVRSRKRGFCMCCRPGAGICCTERTHYDYVWAHQTDFLQIYVARTMLDDHFPDKVHAVLQDMQLMEERKWFCESPHDPPSTKLHASRSMADAAADSQDGLICESADHKRMSLLEAPPPPPVAETALVVSSGAPPQEELPVDLMQLPSIPLQKSLLLLTNFCTNTVRFINHFSSLCEERLATTSKNLTRLEISLAILEAKLNSIPDLPSTATTAPVDLPADLNLPPTDAAPTPPPPPPPGPAPDTSAASSGPPPPPPPPPAGPSDGPPPPPPSPPAAPEVALLKLKDDPMFSKYFTMQRMGMPAGAIRQKILMDGLDPEILSMDPEGPSPSATSLVVPGPPTTPDGPPPEDSSTALALVPLPPPPSLPPAALFEPEQPPPPPPSFGLPPVPEAMNAMPSPPPPPSAPAAAAAPEAATFLKLKDDPMFEKYFKMQKLGMPEGVVRHKLAMDGITLDILSMDPEGPSPNGGVAAPAAADDDDDDF